jgi:two-component system, cell cycle response regulator
VTILIADDNVVSRRLLRAALIGLGHDIEEVEDGLMAVAALTRPGGPAFAIVDWMMPGLDGLEVCRTIRRQPGRYIYVILLTARSSPADMIDALDAGADDFLSKPFNIAELRARLQAGERVLILQDDLLRAHEALRHEATHDRLTNLWNRGRVHDELAGELRRNRPELASMAIMMADVDHFKAINDLHGHAVGDAALQQVAKRIQSSLRNSDSVGRYGGEEFLIILPHTDLNGARDIGERVRAAVSASPINHGSINIAVTMSIGVASVTAASISVEDLLHAADQALYRAKANGRNRVEVA